MDESAPTRMRRIYRCLKMLNFPVTTQLFAVLGLRNASHHASEPDTEQQKPTRLFSMNPSKYAFFASLNTQRCRMADRQIRERTRGRRQTGRRPHIFLNDFFSGKSRHAPRPNAVCIPEPRKSPKWKSLDISSIMLNALLASMPSYTAYMKQVFPRKKLQEFCHTVGVSSRSSHLSRIYHVEAVEITSVFTASLQ